MVHRTPCRFLLRWPFLTAAPLLLVLLAIGIASPAAAQSAPACSEVALSSKAHSRLKALAPGTKVFVKVKVRNAGATAVSGVNMRVGSSVLGGWKAMGGGPRAFRQIEGGDMYWLDQKLKPGQSRRYKARARVCAGAAPGSPAIVEAAIYRLNATGGVLCYSGATLMNVSLGNRGLRGGRKGVIDDADGSEGMLTPSQYIQQRAANHCQALAGCIQTQPSARLPRAAAGARRSLCAVRQQPTGCRGCARRDDRLGTAAPH